MTITVTKGDWKLNSKTFSFYASDKRIDSIPRMVRLKSDVTGKEIEFHQTSVDKDGSGEDIYGWNFVAQNGYKLLIIND